MESSQDAACEEFDHNCKTSVFTSINHHKTEFWTLILPPTFTCVRSNPDTKAV